MDAAFVFVSFTGTVSALLLKDLSFLFRSVCPCFWKPSLVCLPQEVLVLTVCYSFNNCHIIISWLFLFQWKNNSLSLHFSRKQEPPYGFVVPQTHCGNSEFICWMTVYVHVPLEMAGLLWKPHNIKNGYFFFNGYFLISTYLVPGTELGTLHGLCHLINWGGDCCYLHS